MAIFGDGQSQVLCNICGQSTRVESSFGIMYSPINHTPVCVLVKRAMEEREWAALDTELAMQRLVEYLSTPREARQPCSFL